MSGLSPGLNTQFRWVRQLDVSASQFKVPCHWKDGRPLFSAAKVVRINGIELFFCDGSNDPSSALVVCALIELNKLFLKFGFTGIVK